MPEMLGHVQPDNTICSIYVLFLWHIIYMWCHYAACCAMLMCALHMTACLSMPDQALSSQAAGRALRQALQVEGLACRAACNQAAWCLTSAPLGQI